MSDVRTELIQVAAVAIAIVEDMDGDVDRAFVDVSEERQRQDRKWGHQHHPIEKWLAILVEEVGEAAKAANDQIIFPKNGPHYAVDGDVTVPSDHLSIELSRPWLDSIEPIDFTSRADIPRPPAECEHGWTEEHCTKDAEGSCPWNGSKTEIGRGPWSDQECYCPGPGNTTGPTDREMAEFALGIIDGALAFGRAILTPEDDEIREIPDATPEEEAPDYDAAIQAYRDQFLPENAEIAGGEARAVMVIVDAGMRRTEDEE